MSITVGHSMVYPPSESLIFCLRQKSKIETNSSIVLITIIILLVAGLAGCNAKPNLTSNAPTQAIVSNGPTQSSSNTSAQALTIFTEKLPYEYSNFYDNAAYYRDFTIDIGSSPSKSGKIAITITDKSISDSPVDDEKFAKNFTNMYIHLFGLEPNSFEIFYTFQSVNNH